MIEFDQHNLGAEHLQMDQEAERELRMAHMRQLVRRFEVGCSYSAILLGFALVLMMVIRCAVPVYHHFTMSPAPRSPAPQAIASPQPSPFEAGARSTGRVR
jgi:hypothetical protein